MREMPLRLLETTCLASALVYAGLMLSPAYAACGINAPGNFTATVSCASAATNSLTLTGPSTITIGTAGTNLFGIDIAVTNAAANATAVVSDVTINNNNATGGNSIGINVATAAGGTTGNAELDMSGTNAITTAGGNDVLANARGSTGNATITITGIIHATSLGVNNSTLDGVEATARGGDASIDMSTATGDITVHGGNGIFIDSLAVSGGGAGTGNLVGNIGAVTVTMDNTVSGAGGLANSGIQMTTSGLGTSDLTTSATINTLGPLADGIKSVAGAGLINLTNSGNISIAGANSNGIDAIKSNGGNPGQALTITNSGTIITSGTTASSGIIASTSATATSAASDISITNNGDISTVGTLSTGISATSNTSTAPVSGTITINNSATVSTTGTSSAGILASTTVGTASAAITNSGAVTTQGAGSSAITAQTGAGTNTIDNTAALSTSGVNSSGIATVSTTGAIGIGNTAAIQTAGAGANGIEATTASGAVTIDNAGSVTSGQANGLLATATGSGATLALTNEAAGSIFGATGVGIGNNFTTAQLTNAGTIGASTDRAIDSTALTTGPLTINNSGTITGFMTLGSSLNINTLNNSGIWNLRNFNATTGTLAVAVADFGAPLVHNVINNTGTIALLGAGSSHVTTLDTTGQYLPLAPGTVVNATVSNPLNAMAVNGPVQGQILGVRTFNNSGVIDLTANPVPGDVLVISGGQTPGVPFGGAFVSDGGTLRLNTVLNEGGANSRSDMLVVDGTELGSAPTAIMVNNFGGAGALTVGNGIPVVEVLSKLALPNIGGPTSAEGVFVLANAELRPGAFDYRLFHNGVGADEFDGNWYLRSTFVVPPGPPEPPPEPPFPPTPPTPGPGTFPIIGPELATYGVVQPMAQQLGRAMLGTHDERLGDLYPVTCEPTAPIYTKAPVYTKAPTTDCGGWRPAVWGRLFGQQIDNHYQAFADPRTDGQIAGFQAGVDLLRADSLIPGHTDYAGFYAAYGNANVDVSGLVTNAAATGYVLQHTGSLNLNAYSGGAYWTHYGVPGWYLDLTLQGTSYNGGASTEFASLKINGTGFISSLEGGYPIALPLFGPGFVLEPQAQVLWQWVSFDAGNDGLGPVALGTSSETTARVGLKGKWTITTDSGQVWQPYVRANVWSDFGGNAITMFGVDSVPLISHAQYMDVDAGFTTKIDTHLSAFAEAGYQFAISNDGGGKRDGVKGTAGLRYQW